ncbi:MAG: hypothetical protein H6Q89_689 [Myxococcaceae bacterium]|nr:hypothetical protein [Myxococcaceae bacterium]
MGETYRLEAEEESCEAVHEMRDALELQLMHSGKQVLRPVPTPPQQPSSSPRAARKPAIQRSRRT